jgi:hypothetical protein
MALEYAVVSTDLLALDLQDEDSPELACALAYSQGPLVE